MSLINTAKTLCALSGVSGNEDGVREYILSRILPHADEIDTDAMGNLLVFKKGKTVPREKIMLCAHMDEVGLIITDISDEGFLSFEFLGGVDRRVAMGRPVFVGKSRVPAVIGVKPIHLQESSEKDTTPKLESMYLDIGAADKESAEKLVSLGDFAVFSDEIFEFGDGFLKAKALDDRYGCAVMIELIESTLPCDCYFAFSTQEELGTRGAFTAAYKLEPDISIILEGTTAADFPGVSENKQVCCLGDGVVIPFMDGGTYYHPDLHRELTALADRHDIKWQTKRKVAGGTDASAIQKSRAGVKVAALAIPTRNIHSGATVAKISDFDGAYELVKLYLEELSGDNDAD